MRSNAYAKKSSKMSQDDPALAGLKDKHLQNLLLYVVLIEYAQ